MLHGASWHLPNYCFTLGLRGNLRYRFTCGYRHRFRDLRPRAPGKSQPSRLHPSSILN
uniref:Uncharacterized protein n=1 Tax=Anguilla anguilla TaxID=7936 RepID=A0A0E9PY31_ANGAN